MKNKQMRVLLVEDNAPEAAALHGLLIEAPNADVHLLHVESLEEGKVIAANGNIDVILLDLFLPDSRGLQTIISMNNVAPSVPIVALTSVNDNGLSLEAVRVGAQDYLVKGQMDSRLLARSLRYAVERKQAQEQLRQSEEHFRSLIENSLDIITILNHDGAMSYVSPSVKRVVGYLPKELVNRSAFELIHPDDVSEVRNVFLRVIDIPGFVGFAEYRFRRKDGSWCILESIGKYLRDGSDGVVVNSRDITERRQAEEALRESNEQYRRIVETAQEGIWMIDARNKTSFVNAKMAEMLGYTVSEMTGTSLFEFMDEEGRAISAANIERRKQGISEEHEFKFRRKDGSDFWARLSTNPVVDDQGKYAGALAMVTDLTESKRTEQQLRKLSRAVEQSPASIVITDTSGSIEYVNPKFTELTGYSADEVLGKNPRLLKSGKTTPEEYRRLWETITSGSEWRGELLNRRKDGDLFWEFASISPVRNVSGAITHFVAVKEDITERKLAEETLRNSEEKYRMLFDSNPHPMWVYDTTTLAFLAVNDAAIARYGHSRSEFLNMTIKDIRPEEDVPRLIENVKSQKMGLDEAGNWRHRKKDGTIIDVEITSHSLTYEGKNAKLVSAHDITQRKQAEESLRASEERYRRLFEENLTGNFISTPGGVLLSCNLAFARIFGFASVEEAMQSNVKALYPDDSQREALVTQLLMNKRIENYEQVLRQRDGTLIHVVENVIGTFDEHGELIEIKGYLFDDTKRKHLEGQMIQLQKMESIGRLAGGIAHDFNNILGIILGHSTMLDALVDNPAKLSRSIENINKAVQRGSGLVRQILTFARKTNVLFEPVMLNELVTEMEKMLDGTFPKTIEISLQLEKGLPFIDADRTQLHQALLNLCVNARDAMPNGGKLFIRTSKTKGDNLREQGRDATATEYVQIQVSDTGSGMDEATKKRIFEPFFTTKEIGKGTGLGLSVVYGIMKSHRGIVDVETAQGRGTTFHLYFPVHEEVSKPVKTKEELRAEVDGGSETILFVEDEQMLRDLVSSLLQAKGYKILTASNGVEAMDVYAQRRDEIELILTDIGLPKMSGLEMVKKIRGINAAAKVILASGYLDPDDKSELLNAGAHEFVEKPYLPDELFRKIRQVIDGSQVEKK